MARPKKGVVTWKMVYTDFKSRFPNLCKKVIWYEPHSYATIVITIIDDTDSYTRDITYNYDTKEVKFI